MLFINLVITQLKKKKKFTVVCQMFFPNVKSSFSVKTLPIYIYIYMIVQN